MMHPPHRTVVTDSLATKPQGENQLPAAPALASLQVLTGHGSIEEELSPPLQGPQQEEGHSSYIKAQWISVKHKKELPEAALKMDREQEEDDCGVSSKVEDVISSIRSF